MISEETLKKIRKLEIISRKAARDIFAGQYHSAFKGRGMEFSEVREYQFGDDIRFIDWNVSSRLGRLFVKQFVEERELTIILAIDLSASLQFISSRKSKKDIAVELSALIAFTAMLNNDKVGLLIFTDRVEVFIPPKKGRTHLLRLIRDISEFQPQGRGTAIGGALAYLTSLLKKKAVVFLISDFLDDNFATALKIAARKHDLIAIAIRDRRELAPPRRGIFRLRDLESGEDFNADFGRATVRSAFQDINRSRSEKLNDLFHKHAIDAITIHSDTDYEKPLFDLFLKRRHKFAR
ncbi:MAG: DUF58 domain-containing protein [Candidatus Aminicenantes bacterium]|nr:DUF58 domain-containing protein [Candidatus Aminicenantes bacterium]